MKVFIIAIAVLFVFLSWSQGSSLCNKKDPLFTIERSKNENVVHYDACLLKSDNILSSNPVYVYWILENGKKKELSNIEKAHAYGIESKEKLGKNRYRVAIKSFKDREIIIKKLDTKYKALVRINGKLSVLEKVYVKSEEGTFGFPKVEYIDLFGRSLQTNQPVKERIAAY